MKRGRKAPFLFHHVARYKLQTMTMKGYNNIVFGIYCKECDQAVANTNSALCRHLRKIHKMKWIDYLIKHEYHGKHPICACGCGESLRWKKGWFCTFIRGHSSRGKLNGMYGLKGKDNPNFGKIRTSEHKKNYSSAAQKRWKENYDKFIAILNTERYRQKMSAAIKALYQTTDKAAHNSRLMKKLFDDKNPRGNELRAKASLRAISLLEQGKIGPQAPYKAEWKHNPFFNRNEYMHSSWESMFLDQCVMKNKRVTKKHDIRIRYRDENGIERTYVPDFVAPDERIIYEIKGHETKNDRFKAVACLKWCHENEWSYEIISCFNGV